MANHSELKAELERKLGELLDRATEIEKELNEPGSSDWEEQAIETENNEALNEIGEVTNREIHDIKLALHRIESGHYGICSNCGQSIPHERLAAVPFSTTCIQCAAKIDR